jgi:hypothetical protein
VWIIIYGRMRTPPCKILHAYCVYVTYLTGRVLGHPCSRDGKYIELGWQDLGQLDLDHGSPSDLQQQPPDEASSSGGGGGDDGGGALHKRFSVENSVYRVLYPVDVYGAYGADCDFG